MPNSHKITYRFPRSITIQYIRDFVRVSSSIFKYQTTETKNVYVDTSGVEKIDILGSVLLYKFFEYTVRKRCFYRPDTNLVSNTYLKMELDRTGIKQLIEAFIKNGIPYDYNLKVSGDKKFFLVPIVLDKKSKISPKTEYDNINKINSFYKSTPQKKFPILQCIAELSSNFIEHSVLDTKSILLASGNENYFEIACADTGNGIISNLRPVIGALEQNSKYRIIGKAIEKGITSKQKTNHMGQGLWLINQFVTNGRGELQIFTEGAYLINKKDQIRVGDFPFWKGTIIYVKLPLGNCDLYSRVIEDISSETKKYI